MAMTQRSMAVAEPGWGGQVVPAITNTTGMEPETIQASSTTASPNNSLDRNLSALAPLSSSLPKPKPISPVIPSRIPIPTSRSGFITQSPPRVSTATFPSSSTLIHTSSGRSSLDSRTSRTRTQSTPLKSPRSGLARPPGKEGSSPQLPGTRLPGSTKGRSPLIKQTEFSPSPQSNDEETYRFPTPSPDVSTVDEDKLFVKPDGSRVSLGSRELHLTLSRSLERDPGMGDDLGSGLAQSHSGLAHGLGREERGREERGINDEPPPFLVDRSLLDSEQGVRELRKIVQAAVAGSAPGPAIGPATAPSPGPPPGPPPGIERARGSDRSVQTRNGSEDGSNTTRRRAETLIPISTSKRDRTISRSIRDRTPTSTSTQPSSMVTPSKQTGVKSLMTGSPRSINHSNGIRTGSTRTTPVSQSKSRGAGSTMNKNSPIPRPPNPTTATTTNEFGAKITHSPSLAEFPEAYLVPFIPQRTLPKGVRADEAPIPAVERRLMRERMEREGLRDDELVTVWGNDGAPLQVVRSGLEAGLVRGMEGGPPLKDRSDDTQVKTGVDPVDGLPVRKSSRQTLTDRPDRDTPSPSPRPTAPAAYTQNLDEAARNGSSTNTQRPHAQAHDTLTYNRSDDTIPSSPAPFQTNNLIPLGRVGSGEWKSPGHKSSTHSLRDGEGIRRNASLLRKPSLSRKQYSGQSRISPAEERPRPSFTQDHTMPVAASRHVYQTIHLDRMNAQPVAPWENNQTAYHAQNARVDQTRQRKDDGSHGKGGCKCTIM